MTPTSCTGENWTVSLLQALAAGPQWGTSAMFITWDDFGGFYDHVAPTQIDAFGLGFRLALSFGFHLALPLGGSVLPRS